MADAPRLLDSYLGDARDALAAIARDGCKGVGKTAASRLAKARVDISSTSASLQLLWRVPIPHFDGDRGRQGRTNVTGTTTREHGELPIG